MSRNPTFDYFVSFLNVLLTPFINKIDSLRDFISFHLSFHLSFEVINVVMSDQTNFIWKAASLAEGAAVNPNDIRTLLVNGVNTFFINDKLNLSKWARKLNKRPLFSQDLVTLIIFFNSLLIIFSKYGRVTAIV